MQTINGVKVAVAPRYQRQVLSKDVPCSESFRKDFNTWLAGFFGFQETVEDGAVMEDKQNKIFYMNEATLRKLKAEFNRTR